MAAVAVSPPSRGAWIEMVAHPLLSQTRYGRPPRGGRGLKFIEYQKEGDGGGQVAPLAGGVD